MFLRSTIDKNIYLRWTAPVDMSCVITYQLTGYFEVPNTGVESMADVYLNHNQQEVQHTTIQGHGNSALLTDTISFVAGDQLDLVSTITSGEIDGSVRIAGGLSCSF